MMSLGFKSILSHPGLFDLYQLLVGERRAKREFVSGMIRVSDHARLLDLGCGTGAMIPYLPAGAKVVGIDVSAAYVAAAAARHGSRARFLVGDAADDACDLGGQFDVVYAYGVFHHLPDDMLHRMIVGAMRRLVPGGRIVASDPTLVPGQGAFSRFMVRNDRGRFVRSPEQLADVLADFAPHIEVRHDTLRIPFAKALTRMIKQT